jgi:hypothetical protein
MSWWRYVAWGGNERVTVVTEVEVRNRESTGKVGMMRRGYGGREKVGGHAGVKREGTGRAQEGKGNGKRSG